MTCEVRQAGIDTWSPAWYVADDSAAARALEAQATIATQRSRLLPESVAGHRVGWFPSSRLVFAEGHPGGDRLGFADRLPLALDALLGELADRGIPLDAEPARDRRGAEWLAGPSSPGFAGIRRLDVTCDLAFETTAAGLAVLAGVAALGLPRAQLGVRHAPGMGRFGALETVAFYGHGGKKMLARWYDKGVESLSAPRGRLIRPEDQRRYVKDTRRYVDELGSVYVREKFRQRFLPLWRASKGVTVGGRDVMADKLADLVEAGEVTPGMAERLIGFSVLQDKGLAPGNLRTRQRRRAALREHGLVLAEADEAAVEVDLHDVLSEALEAEAWGTG